MKFCPTTLRFSCAVFNLILKLSALPHATFTTNAVSKKKKKLLNMTGHLIWERGYIMRMKRSVGMYRLHLSLHILELR